jgi:tetratricopeptide (TPR) repeat protein
MDHRLVYLQMQDLLWEGRLDAGFALGEQLLDQEPDAECYELLINLLDYRRTEGSPQHLLHLLRLAECEPGDTNPIWRTYLRFVLLERLRYRGEAFALSAQLVNVPARYGWMRYERARLLLIQLSAYDEALRELEAVTATTPRFWKASALRAEVELCRGRESEAFAIFDDCVARLRTEGSDGDRTNSTVWRAELRLWMGLYEQVIEDLREASEAGVPLALGWRGAAYLLSGEPTTARTHLDEALRIDPTDAEALVWRGETLAALGEWEGALADFNHAAPVQLPPLWPLLGRAIVKAHLGDRAGFFDDCDRLAREDIALFRATPGTATARDVQASVAWLRTVRDGARGLRRPEGWLRPTWLKTGVWRETGAFEPPSPSVSPGVSPSGPERASGGPPVRPSLATLFDLTAGKSLSLKALGDVSVESIRHESPEMYVIVVACPGARAIEMVLSTASTRLFLCRTARGHYLSYRGSDPTQAEARAVQELAKYL